MATNSPREIKNLMERYGFKARKSWGQNFLTNKGVIDKLVAAARLEGTETVLEIGPGMGAMTGPLLDAANRVVAVEIDPLLIQFLRQRFGNQENLQLVEGDALAQDYSKLVSGPYILMANLPYYITSPLIINILQLPNPPTNAIILVQWEVGKRLSARPGTPDYGALSVLIQYHCQVELLFKVGPGSFYPPPRVDSAAVSLQWRPPAFRPRNEKFMFNIVKIAFSQRRKMLKGLLAKSLNLSRESVEESLIRAGLSKDIRGERLSGQDFAALADILENKE